MPARSPYLTVAEAAAELRVSPASLYRMIAAGTLRHIRVGLGDTRSVIRIPRGALDELVSTGDAAAS